MSTELSSVEMDSLTQPIGGARIYTKQLPNGISVIAAGKLNIFERLVITERQPYCHSLIPSLPKKYSLKFPRKSIEDLDGNKNVTLSMAVTQFCILKLFSWKEFMWIFQLKIEMDNKFVWPATVDLTIGKRIFTNILIHDAYWIRSN